MKEMYKSLKILVWFIPLLVSCKCTLWSTSFKESLEQNRSYLLVMLESSPIVLDSLPDTLIKPSWYESVKLRGDKMIMFRFRAIEYYYNDIYKEHELPFFYITHDSTVNYKEAKMKGWFSKISVCYVPMCPKNKSYLKKIKSAYNTKTLVYLLDPTFRDYENPQLFSKTVLFNDNRYSGQLH